MLKNTFFIILILFSSILIAQEKERLLVNGKIIVPEDVTPEG